jgi:hypothetical protein
MAITISKIESQPALDYKYLFLERLELRQHKSVDHSAMPKYFLKISYRLFAVDTDGKRYYKQKSNSLIIEDYYKEAMDKALQGDMDLANAAGAIEIALAKIIEDQTDLGTTNVVSD